MSAVFTIVDPFSVKYHTEGKIKVGDRLDIRFNYDIKADEFDASKMIKISPPLPGVTYSVSGNTLSISNTDKNPEQKNTDILYKFTLLPGIKDTYNQPLEKTTELTFKLRCKAFNCNLKADRSGIIVYDPFLVSTKGKPASYVVKSLNYREMRVVLYRMNPYSDLKKWGTEATVVKEKSDTIDYFGYGKKVYDHVIQVENYKENAYISTVIDLSPALENGIGQVGIVVVPTTKR